MAIKCNCKHEYQDKRYGTNMRVMTPKLKVQGKPQEFTCTVCGLKHTESSSK